MRRMNCWARRLRAEGTPLFPASVVIAVVVAWAASGGGYESQPTLASAYEPTRWYAGALLLVGLLCATAFGLGRLRLSRWTMLAGGAFALYVVWSFLSVLWAHDQGLAFKGSDRALVYLAAFLTFAILPWRAWSARVALGLLAAGLGALAVLTTVRLATLTDPAGMFVNARLSYPLGYYNADAAMFMTVAVTSIALCSRHRLQPVLRVAGLVLSALCLQLALLGQSRGWLFTAPIVLLVALLLVPNRLRLLAFALGPALATAAVAGPLLDVYGDATVGGVALTEPRLGVVLHHGAVHAAHAMLIADTLLALVLTLAVAIDRRTSASPKTQRRMRWVGAALTIGIVLAGIAGSVLATHGHPIARLERAWNSFANTNNTANGSSRFTTLGSQRVDFWRVALNEFDRHPFDGIGQDNFAAAYLSERRTDQEPRWAHSIELRLLTHTGIVGALLFALFLLAVALAAAGAWRSDGASRAAAAIALLPLVVWLVHGSIDWLWEFPALSVPALAFAGTAAALGERAHRQEQDLPTPARVSRGKSNQRRFRPLVVLAWSSAAVAALAALIAIALPFQAALGVKDAISVWPRQPGRAYADLRSATQQLPFDVEPYLVGGAIAVNLEDTLAARYWFEGAEHRDHQGWLAHFALGLLLGEQGRVRQARTQLARAAVLNPREPIMDVALRHLARGTPLSFQQAQSLLATRTQQRFGQ